MKKIKIKANAKINLTLDILGVKEGFHILNSLVASVNLHDAITICKRKDDKITLKVKGKGLSCATEDNTAYKSAVAFKNKFNTCGMDIIITKNIPVGGGLGGSSADIAGVLNGASALFNAPYGIKEIADSLGSDSVYMITGGFAKIQNRGEIVLPVKTDKKIYVNILTAKNGVSAGASYKKFDELNMAYECVTDRASTALENGDEKQFLSLLKNDLFNGSAQILPEIQENFDAIKKYGTAVMTGSGSCVLGVYFTKRERDKAYKTLKKQGYTIIKSHTV